MADGKYTYDIIVFDVRDPDLTHAYCFVKGDYECPHTITGWHYKAFPARMNTLEIHQAMFTDSKDPIVMWPLKAPNV